jgi:hypothetical protein
VIALPDTEHGIIQRTRAQLPALAGAMREVAIALAAMSTIHA